MQKLLGALVGRQLDAATPAAGAAGRGRSAVGGGSGSGSPLRPDPVLEHLLRDFRSAKLRAHFFSQPAESYTDTVDVKLLVGTYNVAGKRPPPGLRLHDWLDQWRDCWPSSQQQQQQQQRPGAAAAGGAWPGPDIVAVGFQEVVPLSAGNVIGGPSSGGADAWDQALAATLNGDTWASERAGISYGSGATGQVAGLERLGVQAAYAYSVLSDQAASVVGAMDRMWGGSAGAPEAQQGAAAQRQAARLAAALSDDRDGDGVYVQVAAEQLVGVYLSVWARKATARHLRGIEAAAVATGFGGYLGNKGAVALRMRVYDAPLVLVASHLASGDAEGDEARRNADAADILRRCCFGGARQQQPQQQPPPQLQPQQTGAAAAAQQHWGALSSLPEHANVVWLGDLNYRLCCSNEEAHRLIRTGKLEALLKHDQLQREMAAGRVFQGWREGPIAFNPTYKYHLGCSVYSSEPAPPGLAGARGAGSSASLADSAGGSEADGGDAQPNGGRETPPVEKQKKRTPAWCDRVLWLQGGQLYQLAYGRGELAVSDHRPVAAAFLLQAHRYDRDEVKQLAEASRRAGDLSDNAARPRCTCSPNFVELGLVPFGTPVSAEVRLTNVGPCAASWYFVPPPQPRLSGDGQVSWDDDAPLCPPWLRVQPREGEVAEGEAAAITLTALITGGGAGSAAAWLAPPPPARSRTPSPCKPPPPPAAAKAGRPAAAPPRALDAILILRLEDGADSFVSCRGTWLPSCFGRDLDALLELGGRPVLPLGELGEEGRALLRRQGLDPDGAPAPCPRVAEGLQERVPKEVLRLVGFLQEGGRLHTPGLFVDSAAALLADSAAAGGGDERLVQLLAATAPVRWALDTGLPLPASTSAHHAAAALLLMLQQLPEPLLPDLGAMLWHCVPPPPACSSLLSDAMSVAEWAVLRHVLALCRAALAPEAAAASGLTLRGLAAVLSEQWFGGGQDAVPPELEANRQAFLMVLVDPEGSAGAGAGQPPRDREPGTAAAAAAAAAAQQQQQQDSLI